MKQAKNGATSKDTIERSEEGREADQGSEGRRQAKAPTKGDLRHLHLQGAEAGAPRHGHLEQGHEHHELVRQRHLRAHRQRGLQARQPQRPLDHLEPRSADIGSPSPARRAGQARRERGHQGCHQIHQL